MYNTTQLRHLVGESLNGMHRRKVSGTVAVVIMGSALLMLALFSLVTINLDRVLQTVRGEIDITVFLRDDIHADDRARLRADLEGTEGVLAVQYVTPAQAIEKFRQELGEDADLLDALTANPLPASFEIRLSPDLNAAERLEELKATISGYPVVDEVVAHVEWVKRLDRVTRTFVLVDLLVGLLVLASALFVISNTVRLTIEESSTTIEVMKLVGATNWFIRLPYLLSGALQGALAGGIAMLVLVITYRFLSQQVDGIYFFANGQMLGFVMLSTLLGAGGSTLALRRHLSL